MTPSDILEEAILAATISAQKVISENPDQFYPCGFAWVTIKPARGKFVNFLKHVKIGRSGDYGGYCVSNPSKVSTQWMNPKFQGAVAFASVLNKYGIYAIAQQRID